MKRVIRRPLVSTRTRRPLKSELDLQEYKEALIRAGYTEEEALEIIDLSNKDTTVTSRRIVPRRRIIKR